MMVADHNRVQRPAARLCKRVAPLADEAPFAGVRNVTLKNDEPCRLRHEPSRQRRWLLSGQPETPELIVPVDDDLEISRGGLGFRLQHQETLAVRGDVIRAHVVLVPKSINIKSQTALNQFVQSKVIRLLAIDGLEGAREEWEQVRRSVRSS